MTLPPWHAHVDVWLLLGGVWNAYLLVVSARARAHPEEDPGWARRARLFSLGMLVLLVASDWPIHDLAERYLYSAHMLQHMLYTLVAPPLLIAGMPAWVLRKVFAAPVVGPVAAFLTRPLVALIFFNGVLLFTHWPEVVAASVGSEPTHFALHVLIVGSGLAMWWPVMSPLPERPALNPPGQMLYLFFQSLAPTIPASFLTFGRTLMYPVYGTFPRIWNIGPLEDQLLAGLQMKILGGLLLWVVIGSIFFRWHARESRDGWDEVAMGRLQRELRIGVGE
ncbi:MAG: cytochrome c oxidase assembly protein [Actinomycetota bacterium]